MKFSKHILVIISIILSLVAFNPDIADAAKKSRSKSRTSQTSSKSSKKGKKRTGSSSSKSKRTRKKKSSSYKKYIRRTPSRPAPAPEVVLNDSLTMKVNETLLAHIPSANNPGGLRVNSVQADAKTRTARIGLNENFTYLPVTKEMIDTLSSKVSQALPDSISDFRVVLNVGSKPLSYFITKVDLLPEKFRKNPPFVTQMHPNGKLSKGMENDIIALWHSHGRYFKPGSGGWLWQRPLLFETVEDIYPMAYILPYLTPMLENAGAYVFLPRERDINRHEVIVDNDVNESGQLFSQPYYREQTGNSKWETGEDEGFIYDLPDFRDTENPFENGTYRQTTTRRGGSPSVAAWYADIPEDGEYAVYVSYKSFPNSTEDARYTVNYSGGSKEFKVNQTMGGSTWIYLGTFPLKKGYSDSEPVVTLTNVTDGEEGLLVTADAVKIGGGMGNIARSNSRSDVFFEPSTPEDQNDDEAADDTEEEETEDQSGEEAGDIVDTVPAEQAQTAEQSAEQTQSQIATQTSSQTQGSQTQTSSSRRAPVFKTSGLPRYLEGARYWLHWAGVPESVYSPYHGTDDYKDDYTSRAHWVNYLAGGSRVLPNKEGLGLPVDLAFALHTDAGKRSDDSNVGTLGIYYTQNGDSYFDGTPRINSRMLTDLVMRQITNDVRKEFEPNWTRRSMWDKSYVEARVPEVPTTLIELLSHQNFADMWYGLDPKFRFTVSRAIYKGIARFLAERKGRELVIQPLPVNDFAIRNVGRETYRLSWKPTVDSLEVTAKPSKYIIYERSEGELGFHKIGETSRTHYDVKVLDHSIHSFRIVAWNEGGESFPSETLALRNGKSGAKPVLIINGFDRIDGPAYFSENGRAGFETRKDFGVPYVRDISFAGYQTEFNRGAGESFGRSSSSHIGDVVAGNSFDYPSVHGEAFASAGFGFVSTSVQAVENGEYKLGDYAMVDLILGKQKATTTGRGHNGLRFRTFTPAFEKELKKYSEKGGALIVSGQYVVSDLFGLKYGEADREFAREVLGVEPADSVGTVTSNGRLEGLNNRNFSYSSTLNDKQYIVESPDILKLSSGAEGEAVLTLQGSNLPVGYVLKQGNGQNAVLSIPIESIEDGTQRNRLVQDIITKLKKQ